MRTLYAKIDNMIEELLHSLKSKDLTASDHVLLYEGEVNSMQREFLEEHAQRLCEGKCTAKSALILLILLIILRRLEITLRISQKQLDVDLNSNTGKTWIKTITHN